LGAFLQVVKMARLGTFPTTSLERMEEPRFYSAEELCTDLEDLIRFNPSDSSHKDAWIAKAEMIRTQLAGFLSLDRSSFDYAWHFIQDFDFFSRHPDYYETERERIRSIIDDYKAGRISGY
jgi:hypothetical protein